MEWLQYHSNWNSTNQNTNKTKLTTELITTERDKGSWDLVQCTSGTYSVINGVH